MELSSYSRLNFAYPQILSPTTVAELAKLLQQAQIQGRKITFRGGGNSLHDQSLNDDLVISMKYFNHIGAIDVERQTITVGAGALWKDIVTKTLAHNLVPFVLATTGGATAGGTLSADSISRFSPDFGRESNHVVSLEFLPIGYKKPITLNHPLPHDMSKDAKLFRAIVGGFGYLGIITQITYSLLDISNLRQVSTSLQYYDNFKELVEQQLKLVNHPASQVAEVWEMPTAYQDTVAPYSVLFTHNQGPGTIFSSRYTSSTKDNPYIIYRPYWWFRKVMGFLLSFTIFKFLINRLVCWNMKLDSKYKHVFINDVLDYSFFMDGDVVTREYFWKKWHCMMPTIEQTFVIPPDRTEKFLTTIKDLLKTEKVEPGLLEMLWVPANQNTLSANYHLGGFAVTLAFLDVGSIKNQNKYINIFHQLSQSCAELGGRIHLTKNVYAHPELIKSMFANQFSEFLALKKIYDPDKIIQNNFLTRLGL